MNKLREISTTILFTFFECRLKFIFYYLNISRDIPYSPNILLGQIQHKIRNRLIDNNDFDNNWCEIETELMNNYIKRGLPEKNFFPLNKFIPNYYVEKEKLRFILSENKKSFKSTESIQTYFEIKLKSKIFNVVGIPDLIIEKKSGTTIIDFKKKIPSEIRYLKKYNLQLHIYAYLYSEINKKWPQNLILVDNKNRRIPIKLEKLKVIRYLTYFKNQFIPISEKIKNFGKDTKNLPKKLQLELASPDVEICRRCIYRSICFPYRDNILAFVGENKRETFDQVGILEKIFCAQDGTISLVFTQNNFNFSIRGIRKFSYNIDLEKHVRKKFYIYNIRKTKIQRQYIASFYTVILLAT